MAPGDLTRLLLPLLIVAVAAVTGAATADEVTKPRLIVLTDIGGDPHSALKEGDTPSWFYFLPKGLSDAAHPDWGGWGGRFALTNMGVWTDAKDTVDGTESARATVWRWRPHFQSHFQARMDWCVKPPDEANHAPGAVCNGDMSRRVVEVKARPGTEVRLSAAGSRDPDGDALSHRWWVYGEASHYPRAGVDLRGADRAEATLVVPANTIHLHVILEVADDGAPPLTSYRRVVIRTDPREGEQK